MSTRAPGPPEFWLFWPQVATTFPRLCAQARAAEEAGFDGIALMDHLRAPGAGDAPVLDAMTAASAVLGATERLRLVHLVLGVALRHPAVLAQQVASLDALSGGRVELGLGWGSVADELTRFGVSDEGPATRARRLAETVTIVRALLAGERVEHTGEFHTLRGARLTPSAPSVALTIGGAGPRLTMPLVAAHADWWNLPSYGLGRLDELAPLAGPARRSVQVIVALAGADDTDVEVEAVETTTRRRLGAMGEIVGGRPPEVAARLDAMAAAGVERFVVWFGDRAPPATLTTFMTQVAPRVRRPHGTQPDSRYDERVGTSSSRGGGDGAR